MSELSSAVCSITRTHRRRFFWAAWWTSTPRYGPFQKPDASNGGAASPELALADAERLAGRHLRMIEPHWARAWNRVLRGEVPLPPLPEAERAARAAQHIERAPNLSAWAVLGLTPEASASEIKTAFRKRALETHPDRGGEAEQFRAVQRAYEKLSNAGASRTKKR